MIEQARKTVNNIEERLKELRKVATDENKRIRSDYEEALKKAPEFIENLYRETVGESFITGKIGTETDARKREVETRFKVVDRQSEKEVSHVYA